MGRTDTGKPPGPGGEPGGVELKRRGQAEKRIVGHEKVVETVEEEIALIQEEIRARVVDMPFDEG